MNHYAWSVGTGFEAIGLNVTLVGHRDLTLEERALLNGQGSDLDLA